MRRHGAPFYLKATSLPSAPHVCCVLCGACCALFAVCYVVFGVAVVVVAVVVLIFTLLGFFGHFWVTLGSFGGHFGNLGALENEARPTLVRQAPRFIFRKEGKGGERNHS